MTIVRIGDPELPDHGGAEIKILRTDAVGTPPVVTFDWPVLHRLTVLACTALGPPARFAVVAHCFSDTRGMRDGVGIQAWTDDPLFPQAKRLLRAYTPRLAPGVYHVGISKLTVDGWVPVGYTVDAGVWTPDGTVTADTSFRVVVRSRFEDVYQSRCLFPDPPYPTGPRSLESEPLVIEQE